MQSKDLTIQPENLRRAYAEGCDDVQRTLEHLFPQFKFKEEPKTYPSGTILRHVIRGEKYIISGDNVDEELRLVNLKTGRLYNEEENWYFSMSDTIDAMSLPKDEQENFELVSLPERS